MKDRDLDLVKLMPMKAKNIPVSYVLFPGEGHGFPRPENSQMHIPAAFLKQV